jgi:hypothetical protein
MCNDVRFDAGEAEVLLNGEVVKVPVMVMTCELIANVGEIQFVLPVEPAAEEVAKRAAEFAKKVGNQGLTVVEKAPFTVPTPKPKMNGGA